MDIQQLGSFRTVASLLSFNKAANRLHYAQSGISARTHSLEKELGGHLFDRLTESGALLLQYANKIPEPVAQSR